MNNFKTTISILLIGLISVQFCWAQPHESKQTRIAFYNVENLFDTTDDPEKNDDEYSPDGQRYWTDYRYWQKSNRMAKAILSIGEWQPPAMVGLAEVENRKVVEDLANTEVLRKFKYKVLHFESPDRRGIDVAMLYREEIVTILYAKNLPVKQASNPDFATRDILYAKVLLHQKDTVHLMYCHWPSRYGGQAQSEPNRIRAAEVVRHNVDSIQDFNPNAFIIIQGDLNDEWNNTSVKDYLVAPEGKEKLVNLMEELPELEGSHRYRGVWSYLDQIIVSQNLLENAGLHIKNGVAVVCRQPVLLEADEKYPGQKPFRTYIGMKYHGGFSDHLPIYIDLVHYTTK